ncbi:hypothetical protein CPB84DRAFT_1852314 [Gymnopilus junonius]|uniref:Uncharacterized protein n=1 Tax=Gymnopilus junonius TaxID=109634 RepID=A0A9P5TGP6_GYMJU|nr:hypothetical protein CPB84DRAFT_1852314 [Gymnopilus junonius]
MDSRLVTASEDDSSPLIMIWDLRNARAPEKGSFLVMVLASSHLRTTGPSTSIDAPAIPTSRHYLLR